MNRTRALIATALGILMLGAFAMPAGAAAPRRTIDFVGDSITWGNVAGIKARFTPRFAVRTWARPGTDSYQDEGVVYGQALTAPTVEVINLGTNDTLHIGHAVVGEPVDTLAATGARLTEFAKMFPRSCVVFVTLTTHASAGGWNATYAAAINRHLERLASRNVRIAEWDAAYNPAYFSDVSPHPNALGKAAMLAVEGHAILGCGH